MIVNVKSLIHKLKELKLGGNRAQIEDQMKVQKGSKIWPEINLKWVRNPAWNSSKINFKVADSPWTNLLVYIPDHAVHGTMEQWLHGLLLRLKGFWLSCAWVRDLMAASLAWSNGWRSGRPDEGRKHAISAVIRSIQQLKKNPMCDRTTSSKSDESRHDFGGVVSKFGHLIIIQWP